MSLFIKHFVFTWAHNWNVSIGDCHRRRHTAPSLGGVGQLQSPYLLWSVFRENLCCWLTFSVNNKCQGRSTFFYTENLQKSIRESVKNWRSRIDRNWYQKNQVLLLCTVLGQLKLCHIMHHLMCHINRLKAYLIYNNYSFFNNLK